MLKELLGSIFGGGSSSVKNASVNETIEVLKNKNVQFIDVRSAGEYKSGHAKKAVNFPLDRLENLLTKLDKNKPVYVICQSGMRSMRGALMLEQAGFTEVYNVSGGTSAWISWGLETER